MLRYLWRYLKTWLIVQRKRLLRLIDKSKGEDFTRFVIVCAPRSGSTMLHTYLNSHSQILSHGEIIRRRIEQGEDVISIKEFAFSPQSKKIKAVGLKLFYEHMDQKGFKVAFDEVLDDDEIKVIHLQRRDKRKQFLSLRKAEKSGAWSSTLKQKEEVEVSITEQEYVDYEKEQQQLVDRVRERFAGHEVIEVSYEELVKDPKHELERIQQFIEVEPKKLFTLLQKQGE